MKPLLIEIGSEEIPARFVASGLAALREGITGLLDNSAVTYGKITEYATPRRLAICVDSVEEKQDDRTIESLGPPKTVAFDKDGAPTKAALGFARSLNVDVSELKIKATERGEYLSATIEEKGRATGEVLAEALPGIIASLQLPKSMRWGSGTLRYFRPIRWILALFGEDLIPFELEGMKSSASSYGHRFLSPDAIRIEGPAAYLPSLKGCHVLADPAERKRAIEEGIQAIEASEACIVRKDPELLDIVTNLVEYPTAVLGHFDEKYIELPGELLVTVMKSHQKYFSVEDKDGNMRPSFIVVSNTSADNNDTVRRGAERVLRARLEDARFYYAEDQKKALWDYVDDLKKVTFQEKLGSIHEKTIRISALCSFIADSLEIREKEKLERAAMLCKTDLVTGVVGEFPELQGYMGMTYAVNSGEDKDVASAVYEHYQPRFAGDELPSGELGAIVSLADKMDNIASFFFLDLIPTGSEDPYALRRQAAGAINILEARGYPFSLNLIIDKSLQSLEDSAEARAELSGAITQFFRQRLEGILSSRGSSHDIISAVLAKSELNITDIKERIISLSTLKKEAAFPALLIAAKRVNNILSRAQPVQVKEELFKDPEEKRLFDAVHAISSELAAGDFKSLFTLEEPITALFDKVMVMDKDPDIRDNRLALLVRVKHAFDALADFSKIVD